MNMNDKRKVITNRAANRDVIRSKRITIGEVADILNEFDVKFDARAQCKMIRAAKYPITFKYVMNRTLAYTKAFFPALIFTIGQKLNIKGRYSKGGVVSGRKDM